MRRAIIAAWALLALSAPCFGQATATPTPILVFKLDAGGKMVARGVVATITPGLCPKSQADGKSLSLEECGGGGGSGDVSGPGSSTDHAVTRWDGTAGDTIQDSSVTIDDSGNMSLPADGRVTASEVEVVDTDTHDTCSAGEYYVFADTSESKMKKCQDGAASDIGQSGSLSTTDELGVTCVSVATNMAFGATLACAEGDTANDAEIDRECSEKCPLTEANLNSASGVTINNDVDFQAEFNVLESGGGSFRISDRPIVQAPAIELMCDNYALDSGRRYCRPHTHEAKSTASHADQRMAFTCANLRTITATFSDPDDGSDYDWPSGNTLTIGFAILPSSIPGTTHCTYVSAGGSSETSCDDIDTADAFERGDLVAVWVNNSGSPASTDQADVAIQVYCGH